MPALRAGAFLPLLRRVATRAPAPSFTCRQCLHQPRVSSIVRQQRLDFSTSSIRPAVPKPIRSAAAAATPSPATATASTQTIPANEADNASSSSSNGTGSGSSSFPDVSSKSVAYWLVGSALSVFGIVVFGGLTRLTESGLSITEWRPVTGSLPPLSEADWASEFEKYRASPEFRLLNPTMELSDFKKIYFMEWTHRLWGRFVGLSFVLPAAYFIVRRRVSARMAWNLVGISGLIGFQGFIGWWMVKSGLKDDLFAPGSHPRVSQYRLTAHLATAFVCYSWMLGSAMSILRHRSGMAMDPAEASKLAARFRNPVMQRFRLLAYGLTGLVFITAMSGALVAGLDAGLIYNEFPHMGLGLTPPASELWDKFYSRKEDGSDLWWRNMLENPSLVQLDHRILATTTFTAIVALFAYSRTGRVAAALPANIKKSVTGVVHLALMQVTLGICTLLWLVPVPLAAAHQAGSLMLLTGSMALAARLHLPRSVVAAAQRHVAKASKA